MKGIHHIPLALTIIIAAQPAPGHGQTSIGDEPWGAKSFGFVANRFGSAGGSGPFSFMPDSGGAGFLNDAAVVAESRGSIRSSVILNNSSGISVPEIRSFAQTAAGEFTAEAAAVGVEGYIYQGSDPKTFTLNVILSGTFANMANDFAGNFARLSVWSGDSGGLAASSIDPIAAFDSASSFFFSTSASSYAEFGFDELDSLALKQNGLGGDVLSGSLSWTMEPGDEVFLHALGFSRVYGPSSTADASGTLTLGFEDSAGLTSFSGGVIPEPTLPMLGSLGLALLVIRRRR